jgi:hypothetical protein
VNWKNAPERVPHHLKVMSTAYVMSRNVIIKALLPHRDTISIMTASPLLSRRHFTIPALEMACRRSQNQSEHGDFVALCPDEMHRN